MPRLRVLAGPSPTKLSPISVNTSQAHEISSELFEGKIVVHIKGFNDDGDEENTPRPDGYFENEDRRYVTWSIQVQGRFLREYNADDVLFGNTFDRPLKLPWGTSVVLKFMNYIDPTLEHDLQSTSKPWALSPLISTMPYFAHRRLEIGQEAMELWPEFPGTELVVDDVSQMHLATRLSVDGDTTGGSDRQCPDEGLEPVSTPYERRTYFSSPEKRKQVTFGPSDLLTTDFCYGFLSFAGQSGGPRLEIPGGISFDLGRYWDGQPVRFVCCERKRDQATGDPWGDPFWCVAIELEEDTPEASEDDGAAEDGTGGGSGID
ncbi:DUF1769-domain-containing protein [Coprinellus micaceus]|uniref:DUF1769-domain-containing protein n=1 Tax=Coprinellus micaceus TaxID=71717 RepID=A0A4Y7TJX1_COPMI|nr:DUF1769-domain-containing protein [Coprinellus micaceus]